MTGCRVESDLSSMGNDHSPARKKSSSIPKLADSSSILKPADSSSILKPADPFLATEFARLPDELQVLILTFRPSAIILFSQVSHRYERLLESAYVSIIGRRRITTQQEFTLAKDLPIRACILDLGSSSHCYAKYWSVCHHYRTGAFAGGSIELDHHGRVQSNQLDLQSARDIATAGSSDPPGRYHCSTMESFIIYTRREKCMRIDPNYARDKVLSELDERHDQLQLGLRSHNRLQYYRSIVQAYVWSGMDIPTCNLPHRLGWNQLKEIDHNLETILAAIERIYRTVRHRVTAMSMSM